MKVRRATLTEQLKIVELLNQHIVNNGEHVRYEKEWNDERIAHIVSLELSRSHVATVRRELFGKLVQTEKKSIEERISELELRIETLEGMFQ